MSEAAPAGHAPSGSAVRQQLLARLGHLPPRVEARPPRRGRVWRDGDLYLEHWRIAGPRDEIPAWFIASANVRHAMPTVLALHPHGRQFEVAKSLVAGLVESRRAYGRAAAEAGFAVLVPDLPGFEERRPGLIERKANYALQGEAYERLLANTALVQGSTLQAWILADIQACLDVLELDARVNGARLGVLGQSFGGQEAIFAMLFDERLRAGVASCGLSLVRLLVERQLSHNMALYVPGLLPNLDFDVLVPALAPRPLCVIAGRQDAIFPIAGVEQVERAARAAYAAVGAEQALRWQYFDGPHDLPAEELESALRFLQEALS